MTIRSTPASSAARSTRSAPSRAGTISSSGSLGWTGRERRGDVEDVAAARDRLGPPGVGREVGGDDLEAVAACRGPLRDRGAHRALAREVAHGRTHVVAPLEQLAMHHPPRKPVPPVTSTVP